MSRYVKPQSAATSSSNDRFLATLNPLPISVKESDEMPVMKILGISPDCHNDFSVLQKLLKLEPARVPSKVMWL